MPPWLLRAFLAASVALYIMIWTSLVVQNATISGLRRDIDRVDERLTRTHFMLYPIEP